MRSAARTSGLGAAVMVIALVLAACSGTGDDSGKDRIVSASWGDPQKPLEPANTYETRGGAALDMIFRGLKKYDPKTGEARNCLADSITTTDQRRYTIRLRQGWTFSNGEPVTAHSFVDAWNFGALGTNQQVAASFFSYIDGYDKVHPATGAPLARTMSGLAVQDDRTFTVRLSQKFSLWPDTLGSWAYFPLPRLFFTQHEQWLKKPVGNGPYQVASYSRGERMRLRAWDGYMGPDKARNDGVDLRVYTDTHTAYTDLLAGNVDVVHDIPAVDLKNAKQDLGPRFVNQPAGVLVTLGFPMYDPQWSGPDAVDLRRGLSMAVNRAMITERIFHQTRVPASDWTTPVLGSHGGHQPGLCGAACTYDPAEARKLIAAGGGLPGGQMKITYNADVSTNREWVDAVCHSINNTLGDSHACVGQPVPTFAQYRDRITNRSVSQPFSYAGQMDYPLIQDFLQPNYYTGGAANDTGFHRPRFDELIDQANAAATPAEAVSRFQEAERDLSQQMPSMPLWYQNGTAGYSSRLSNVSLTPFGVPDYSQVSVN
ncbi:peptide ABC transporter substrate-binding protein [Streptomyces sp. ERV7]|uniref:peptide ABC transporter substrate-binding protein n=1 Tax=Streptomyces sp. ERV7 TaxID=1322334 RepID=UPI0007F407B8|nr:ABC transporter substrate-binding protein [Streptomyces sp. ERV7]OAR26815.1 peptide ABC transporter substrate-binding protein [Streptomyces sp. ERV7]